MAINKTLHEKIAGSGQFLKEDIWRLRADKLKPGQSFWITPLRIVVLAIRKFQRGSLRAARVGYDVLLFAVACARGRLGVRHCQRIRLGENARDTTPGKAAGPARSRRANSRLCSRSPGKHQGRCHRRRRRRGVVLDGGKSPGQYRKLFQ